MTAEDQLDQITDAAKILGLKTEVIEVPAVQELEKAFKLAQQKKAGAILFMSSPVFYVNRKHVASLARAAKLPGITGMSQIAEEGILLSYGNDVDAIYRRTGYYLDRILKGTAPRDLPVEQVTILTLTANFKTAKALGIKFPESILVRVDKAVR
ncbi:MAG: ABC transporter substrate binding protein [Burkholderiales bacterium]